MLEIFTYTTTDYSMTEAEEAASILAAQAGDDAAKMALLRAYGPALRSAVARFGKGSEGLEVGDLQSAALASFLELIVTHDPEKGPRLAGRVTSALAQGLAEEFASSASFTVPSRTLKRFFGVLKAADGDVEEAERLASEFGMGLETFRAVLAAVRTSSLEARQEGGSAEEGGRASGFGEQPVRASSPVADVEDRVLVEMAFSEVSDEEARIVELAYGFTEYDPVPDAEIGHRLGLTRPTVQRRRASALGTMRKTIGVTEG